MCQLDNRGEGWNAGFLDAAHISSLRAKHPWWPTRISIRTLSVTSSRGNRRRIRRSAGLLLVGDTEKRNQWHEFCIVCLYNSYPLKKYSKIHQTFTKYVRWEHKNTWFVMVYYFSLIVCPRLWVVPLACYCAGNMLVFKPVISMYIYMYIYVNV